MLPCCSHGTCGSSCLPWIGSGRSGGSDVTLVRARRYVNLVLANTSYSGAGDDATYLPVPSAVAPIVSMRAYVGENVDRLSEWPVGLYAVKLKCRDDEVQTVFVCECGDMRDARTHLMACDDLSRTTARELLEATPRCVHSRALDMLVHLLPAVQAMVSGLEPVASMRDARFGAVGTIERIGPDTVLACLEDHLGGSALFTADVDGVLACATCSSHRRSARVCKCYHFDALEGLLESGAGMLPDAFFLRSEADGGEPEDARGAAETEAYGKRFVSHAPRLLHSESSAQRHRTTHQHVGLLPDCYFCKQLRCERDTLQYKVQAELDRAGVPYDEIGWLYPATAKERASFARELVGGAQEELGSGAVLREVEWRAGRDEADPGVDRRWRADQARWWRERGIEALRGSFARLWTLDAALGESCRHCVDDAADAPGMCTACSGPLDADPVGNDTLATRRESLLLGTHHSEVVRVYERRCLDCGKAHCYDGAGQGVANWSNHRLFCEEVLRCFWNTFFTQKQRTVHAYWKHMCQAYELTGSSKSFVSRQTFTSAVFAFVDLLDVRYEAAFMCPVCRHLHHREMCVLLDGICMGFSASRRLPPVPPPRDDADRRNEV